MCYTPFRHIAQAKVRGLTSDGQNKKASAREAFLFCRFHLSGLVFETSDFVLPSGSAAWERVSGSASGVASCCVEDRPLPLPESGKKNGLSFANVVNYR